MRQGTKKKHKEENAESTNKIVPFERDVGYYLNKGNQHLFKNNWPKAFLFFKKSIEINPDDPINHYNLAYLLTKMGRIQESNRVFEYILNKIDDTYWECYFFLAVNYGMLEDMERAQAYLQVYLNNAPEGEMRDEAEELFWAITGEDIEHYNIPDEFDDILFKESKEQVIDDLKKMDGADFIKKYEKEAYSRQLMSAFLYQGNDLLAEDMISYYGNLANGESLDVLREFVRNPWAKDRLKQMALLKLKNFYPDVACNVFLRGRVQELDLKKYPLRAPLWKEEWHQVLCFVLRKMREGNDYDENFFDDVQAIWIDYINLVFPDAPRFTIAKTWAAGLEYSLVRFHFLGITQKEIADKYGVSVSSVANKFKAINNALRIDKKAYRNMLFYLMQAEKDRKSEKKQDKVSKLKEKGYCVHQKREKS